MKKQLIRYGLVLLLAALSSLILPHLLERAGRYAASRIREKGSEKEAESERATEGPAYVGTLTGEGAAGDEKDPADRPEESGNEEENTSGRSADDPAREQKEQMDTALKENRRYQDFEVLSEKQELYELFIGDRETAFRDAVADFLFSVYGDVLSIRKVRLMDLVGEDPGEITCRVHITGSIGGKEEGADYLAKYSQAYDFYSIYAYQE